MTEYIELELDSNVAIQAGYPGQSSTDCPQFTIGRHLLNITGLKVLEVSIPFSYYTITSTPNFFGIPGNRLTFYCGGSLANNASIDIPAGNYTATGLASEMQSLMSTSSFVSSLTGFGMNVTTSSFSVTYNSQTGHFTWQVTETSASGNGPVGVYISATSQTYSFTPLSQILGLPITPVAGVQVGTISTVTGTNVANLTGPNYLYVCSQTLGPILKAYVPQAPLGTSGQTNPQIALVPVNCNPGGTIWWKDPNSGISPFDAQSLYQLNSFDLYLLLGTSTTPLQLNGLPWTCKILLELKSNDSVTQAGTMGQDRVIKRIKIQ